MTVIIKTAVRWFSFRSKHIALFLSLMLITFSVLAIPIPVALNVSLTPLGSNWTQTTSGGIFPIYTVTPIGEHSVTIFFDDDSEAVFDMELSPMQQQIVPVEILDGAIFTPRSGTDGSLVALDSTAFLLIGGEVYDSSANVYDPTLFSYTYATGESIVLDRNVLPTSPPGSIPEPITLSLVGLGLAGLGFSHKRK